MHDIGRIPGRLNGYDIVAVLPKLRGNKSDLHPPEVVILGHDPSRRNSKFVTAYINLDTVGTIREWYWGNYMEDIEIGMMSLLRRAGVTPPMLAEPLFGGEKV